MYGIVPVRRPSIPAPELRVQETEIPGMDGVLFESDGTYAPITIEIDFNFLAHADDWMKQAREVKKYFSGNGWLKLGDDRDFLYRVYYAKIKEIERSSRRIGNVSVEFYCDPFSYPESGQYEYDIEDVLFNPYFVSHPLFKITGYGGCTLSINGNNMTAAVNGKLNIDTELMISYEPGGEQKNTAVNGDYSQLYLQEGNNTISITTGFSVKIIPNWRTL